MNPADQFGANVAGGIADAASGPLGHPLVQLLMKLMAGGGQTPPPATTSQQTGPYQGPMASPEMMQGVPGAQPTLKQKLSR